MKLKQIGEYITIRNDLTAEFINRTYRELLMTNKDFLDEAERVIEISNHIFKITSIVKRNEEVFYGIKDFIYIIPPIFCKEHSQKQLFIFEDEI